MPDHEIDTDDNWMMFNGLARVWKCKTCGTLVHDIAAHQRWANADTPAPEVNAHEAAARTRKATAIAEALASQGIPVTFVRDLPADQRATLAKGIGVNAPSQATWDEAMALLEAHYSVPLPAEEPEPPLA